jgi:hypothetical protein
MVRPKEKTSDKREHANEPPNKQASIAFPNACQFRTTELFVHFAQKSVFFGGGYIVWRIGQVKLSGLKIWASIARPSG